MPAKRYLVTAALPYSNGMLHVGHIAGAYLPADICVRYLRLRGHEVRFVCGSDDYGVANVITAAKEGRTPAETAAHYNRLQQDDFRGMGIDFDVFGSTSRSRFHAWTSQEFFLALHRKGFFQKKTTSQFYDAKKEMFLPDRYVEGACGHCGAEKQRGDQCENCGELLDTESLKQARSVLSGEPAMIRQTVHWYLDMSRFSGDVKAWLEKATLRDDTRKYVASLVESGLVSRPMTRDISWGVPLPIPDDPDALGKVLYVWFDAPIGYISNTKELCERLDGSPDRYADWWKSDETDILHFIGEDNTVFHCVIWVAMLTAEGTLRLPKAVIVNKFLNVKFPDQEAEKISKSRGAAVWVADYLANSGNPDALRYYLTLIAPESARTVYQPEDLIRCTDSDLADTLGNFVNRTLTFAAAHVGPAVPAVAAAAFDPADEEFTGKMSRAHASATDLLDRHRYKEALNVVMEFARECNRYVDNRAPWKTRKTDLERTRATMLRAMNAIKFLSICLRPFLPGTSDRMAGMLGLDGASMRWDDALVPLSAGTPLGRAEILFAKSAAAEA